ncbi:MAG TPA: glycosyltransferase family A protein [Candidatus Krumholzibacteria bacterium]|nr:glycosyltransferase family A protein [Candidatus Krumholzibacteria bacterium]
MSLVSIVICTYNRASLLRATLERCLALEPPRGGAYEVVVVDNNSTNDTRRVVEAFAAVRPDLVRCIDERRPGLAYARNAGVRAARGSIICCTDDDCVPSLDWIAAAAEAFARDEELALIGGRVELADPLDAPIGVRTGLKPLPIRTPTEAFDHMIGCNLSFRRQAFDRIGGYDGRFGRPGGVTGDDADFVIRALRRGLAAAYRPEVLVLHHHGRRTAVAIRATKRSYARGRGAVYCKHVMRGDPGVLKSAYWEMRQSLERVLRWRRDPSTAREAADHLRNLVSGGAYFLARSLRG